MNAKINFHNVYIVISIDEKKNLLVYLQNNLMSYLTTLNDQEESKLF